ncbi:MAG TPA: hypothetical protein VF446_10295 [Trinickia sp.]
MRHLLKAVRSVKYSPYSESITTSMVVPLNDSAASFCRPTDLLVSHFHTSTCAERFLACVKFDPSSIRSIRWKL